MTAHKRFKVYALYSHRNQYKYIGSTELPIGARLKLHIAEYDKGCMCAKCQWLGTILRLTFIDRLLIKLHLGWIVLRIKRIYAKVLERTSTKSEALAKEQCWIDRLTAKGHLLTNTRKTVSKKTIQKLERIERRHAISLQKLIARREGRQAAKIELM